MKRNSFEVVPNEERRRSIVEFKVVENESDGDVIDGLGVGTFDRTVVVGNDNVYLSDDEIDRNAQHSSLRAPPKRNIIV